MASHRVVLTRDQLESQAGGGITRRALFLCDSVADLPIDTTQHGQPIDVAAAGDVAIVISDNSVWSYDGAAWVEASFGGGAPFSGLHADLTDVTDSQHHNMVHDHSGNSDGGRFVYAGEVEADEALYAFGGFQWASAEMQQTLTADVNDFLVTDDTGRVRFFTNTGDHHVTGLSNALREGTALNSAAGIILLLRNAPTSTGNVILDHNSGSSTTPFVFAEAANVTLRPGEQIAVIYNELDGKWGRLTADRDTVASSTAGPDADVTIDSAGAAGTASTFARSAHGHKVATDSGVASTQAFGDAATAGTSGTIQRGGHKHAMPNSTAGPDADITIDAAGAAGTAATAARSAHGHKLATSASVPGATTVAGAAGTSGVAPSRGDHAHPHEAAHIAHDTLWDAAGDLVQGSGADTAAKLGITVPAANILNVLGVANGETTASWKSIHDGTNPAAIGTAAPGTSLITAHRDHVHATGAGVPVTQAFGDAAATGSGPAAAMTDHKHGMPAATLTKSFWISSQDMTADGATRTQQGTAPDIIEEMLLADAATQGAYFHFIVPYDWSSGALTYTIYWAPGSTDATPHTVRWSTDVLDITVGTTSAVSAGTTTAFTGTSAARTVAIMYTEPAQTLLTPGGAAHVVRVNIRRLGSDAADTYVGAVRLHGVLISYTGSR